MVIDESTLMNALQNLAIKYRLERERTKSVTRTIAKAKQEAILEVIDIVSSMEKMPAYLVQRDQEAKNPWRYFSHVYDKHIRRVKRGEVTLFMDDGRSLSCCVTTLEWYLDQPKAYHEITEAEAVKLLGGKRPWATPTQRDHQ